MKTKFPFTQVWALAFMVTMSLSSFATEGCTTHQTFGPERTFVDNGTAGQHFTPCQSGDLEFISVYMQGSDVSTFGTHLNVFEVNGDELVQIHEQQVVVPSLEQNPYAKIWLADDVVVEEGKHYAFEVEVPADREIIFYHTDENKYSEGDFHVNGAPIAGDLAFEMGINSAKKSLFQIRGDAGIRANVEPWLLEIEEDYDCLSMQRYFDTDVPFELETITQTMTACNDGVLTDMFVKCTFLEQGAHPSVAISITAPNGIVVGTSQTVWNSEMEYLSFPFQNTILDGGTTYTISLDQTANPSQGHLSVVSLQQYFVGQMTSGGQQIMNNVCFMGLVSELIPIPDGEHDHDPDVDHNIYDDHDPYAHDFYVKPPSEVEELRHTVFPNPFIADFRVELETDAQVPGTVTLYNFMGKKVFEQKLENVSDSKYIEVNPQTVLNKGYYTLRIEYGDNIILDTVVKN